MKALWLEDRELSVRDIEVPSAGGEALVRVRLSGICGTDLELRRGYYPYTGVPGHEFVGEVAEAPEPSWIGRRVVGEINDACGACATCRRGHPTHCERRTVLGIVGHDGAHAEYVRIPTANLHRVPDGVTDEAAVFTEPLAAALEVLEQVHIRPGDRVLLVGAGRLGQLVGRVLALTGAHLRAVARYERQAELLALAGIEQIAGDEAGERCWDVVVEATGSPSGLDLARRTLRPRGTLVLKSTYHGEVTLDLAPFVVDEITIVGSRCGPFAPALELLATGRIDPVPLIEARYPLASALEAFEAAVRPGAMKVLLEP
ncbi:MAG: alcohol dehydrogenase catalytic domain-containing protein [Anaerosomatales bacterium]|nr:alcohol dehydrogenase catalytic domain-containing protein [Anaerosomatales bacterium]MDT8433787.1 alcohol dehydrogenase catalytic domain-containing protein [Anaerosomatales bacterium]